VKRRGQPETSTWQEDIRRRKLAEVRERAAEVAAIVVRLPRDRAAVPGSEAHADLLSRFGLTAAWSSEWMTDEVQFVAETTDHYAV